MSAERVLVDEHGCVWADGSLLLCPAEQSDHACECTEHGAPATARSLVEAVVSAVRACSMRVRWTYSDISATVAEVRLSRPGGSRVRVLVGWDPDHDVRPIAQVREQADGVVWDGPPLVTDALWQAASRALRALRCPAGIEI